MGSPRYEELSQHFDSLVTQAKELMDNKNADYTNDARGSGGCLSNFMKAEEFGICSSEQGIMVRFLDKAARLSTLIRREGKVSDEKLRDTVLDTINYAVILDFLMDLKSGESAGAISL